MVHMYSNCNATDLQAADVMGITWGHRITNEAVKQKPLLEVACQRKLQWFGHSTSRADSLAQNVRHGSI